jgi:hypothetical protein
MRAKTTTNLTGEVTETSETLDLERTVFKLDPARIAQAIERSAEFSRRRKAAPYRAVMAKLPFYVNRAGANLTPVRKRKLHAAKAKLREVFGRKAT